MHTLKVTFSDDVMLKIRDLAEEHNVIPATVVEDITRWFTEGRLRPVKEKKKNCSALGQRIKAAIKELGWTQTGLAEVVGCAVPTISRWITRVRTPGSKHIKLLSIALGMPVDELVGGNDVCRKD